MGGVASTTSSNRHSSISTSSQMGREGTLRNPSSGGKGTSSGNRIWGNDGRKTGAENASGGGSAVKYAKSKDTLKRHPSVRGGGRYSGVVGCANGVPVQPYGVPPGSARNMGGMNRNNSLLRMNSTNSLVGMDSTNSLLRMNSTNSLMRMGSTNSLMRMNSGNIMLSGNGTGPDYFRDLLLNEGMGNRTPSMMQNDVDSAPGGGSFYDSLSKHGDSFRMQGGPYGSFRKAFPATPANPAGGAKRFIKPADPAGPRLRGETSSPGDDADATLKRYDSTNKLQRQYSIAGQFYQFNNANFPRGGGMPGFGGNLSRAAMCPQPQPQRASNLKLNAQNGSISAMNVTSLNAQASEQRRLGSDPKRRSFHSVSEGASQTSPSAGSLPLERKDSQKRVGMYFKKVNHERDGMEYRKEGETTGSTRNPDYNSDGSSQVCYVKPILLYEAEVSPRGGGGESSVEVDGCTVRYSKAPQEEIHKYDMSDVICVKIASDMEVQSDSLDEIREHFLCGSNVSMIMADMDGAATNPQTWFSWLALKYVVKETFARLDNHSEFTMSACLLQDDQVMDLFGDGNLQFEPLKVAESPYFGNVAHGLTYIAIDSAKSFNQSLSRCLAAAGKQMERNKDEEQGIILITSLLKQIRTSKSGNKDVWISSIFSTGVGDGIIHYNRILDKNPAEPRAVFYAALHRSVYSTAIFSLRERSQGLYQCLSTLQRFSKVETRKPKVNSVSVFIHFAEMTIAKMKEDMQAAQNTLRYPMIVKFLEKMEIMLADSREMLESPESCIPKTYM